MNEGFLECEAKKANKRNRKKFLTMMLIYICIVSFLFFALKDIIDLNDYESRKIVACFFIFSGIMIVCVVGGLLISKYNIANGNSLNLPFKEDTKSNVAKLINQEASEGKILVDEYSIKSLVKKEPKGERIVLTNSYLLMFNSMGKVTAIPRDKIYWICAQTGIKGRSSYIVRFMVFTPKKIFSQIEGVDVEHFKNIADKIYQYIPNVFCNYDLFSLSYKLEELFDKNREEFLSFYENEKEKYEHDFV